MKKLYNVTTAGSKQRFATLNDTFSCRETLNFYICKKYRQRFILSSRREGEFIVSFLKATTKEEYGDKYDMVLEEFEGRTLLSFVSENDVPIPAPLGSIAGTFHLCWECFKGLDEEDDSAILDAFIKELASSTSNTYKLTAFVLYSMSKGVLPIFYMSETELHHSVNGVVTMISTHRAYIKKNKLYEMEDHYHGIIDDTIKLLSKEEDPALSNLVNVVEEYAWNTDIILQ